MKLLVVTAEDESARQAKALSIYLTEEGLSPG